MERDNATTTQQRGQDESSKALSIQSALEADETHDVIGVVVNISVDAVNSKAQVLIADTSIPKDAYARLSLVGTDMVTASLGEVSVGDMLRFHGFNVAKHNSNKLPLVADFYPPWQEPDTGWTRLHIHGEQVSCEDEATARRIQDLIAWFPTTTFNDSIPALPCRRRLLSELHTAGITSHVVARVVSIDTAAVPPPAGSKKRKRWLPIKRHRTTVAVLSDGGEVMPFLDCAAHESTLKDAVQSGKEVLLTNVVTCAADEKSDRDVVLRPTDSTSVFPMLNSSSSERQAASYSCRETQFFSLTQDLLETGTTQTLSSPLRDVYIDELGVSLGDGKRFVSPNGFVSTIIDKSGNIPRYRDATLTLLDGMVVKADATMMQTLCGSIDPDTLLNHGRLRTHVTDLMRGLLDEQVTLTWTLQRDGDTYHATKCFLPRL